MCVGEDKEEGVSGTRIAMAPEWFADKAWRRVYFQGGREGKGEINSVPLFIFVELQDNGL